MLKTCRGIKYTYYKTICVLNWLITKIIPCGFVLVLDKRHV